MRKYLGGEFIDSGHKNIRKLAKELGLLADKFRDRIETNTRLESLRSTANGRYRVSLFQGSTNKESTFDRVILALPFNILRSIDLDVKLPPRKQAAIKEMGYGTNTKVITSYSDRLWRTKYRSNGESFSDLDTSETWEATRYNDTKAGLITSFNRRTLLDRGSRIYGRWLRYRDRGGRSNSQRLEQVES